MNTIAPSPSPVVPVGGFFRRKYSDAQIIEAKRLALSDGVAFASEKTGVSAASIYKLIKPPKPKAKAAPRKPTQARPERAMLASPQYKKAKAMGEMFFASIPGSIVAKRKCMDRAAERFGLDRAIFWRAYKLEQYAQR
jgi:hypothetical protein